MSAPFHCSLMKPASKDMEDKINNTKLNSPLFKIISNVTAKPETEINKIKKLLVDQIFQLLNGVKA